MIKKIKVCHFSSVHKDNDIRIYSKECLTLADAGYETILIASDGKQQSERVKIVKIKEEAGRLRRILIHSYAIYKLALSIKADIYHFHDPELLPYGLIIKMTTQAKVVYDSHECYPEDLQNKEWLPHILRKPIARSYRFLEDVASKKLDLVVAATPYIQKRFHGIARKVITVNNYPRLEEFSSFGMALEEKPDGVCYVGAISRIRGVLQLLDSLDHINPNVRVYMAGTFANNEIKKTVFDHRNWGRVDFYGQVNRDHIKNIYRKSFAGIVNFLAAPNHEYSQPNKLFEYMAAGIPVIGSNFELWKEIIESSSCGITVQPDSAVEIANAINLLSLNKNLVNKMGQAGLEAITRKYSWEREGAILVNAYKELCNS